MRILRPGRRPRLPRLDPELVDLPERLIDDIGVSPAQRAAWAARRARPLPFAVHML